MFSLYPLVAAVVFGLFAGGGGSWYVQELRLNGMQSRLETVIREGEEAQARADAKAAEQQILKEQTDHEYKTAIDNLNSDVERLRLARARVHYVPAAAPSTRRPDLACFDRSELEHAIRQLDDGLSSLIAEGDTGAVGLNVARDWAAHIQSGTSLENPATSSP